MCVFKYYAELRADILEIITGVENSGWSLFWDETTPNYITRGSLKKLYNKYLKGVKEFGLYVVTRHSDCPNPKHHDYHDGYPVQNDYGLTITYRDERYVCSGAQMYQGARKCVCPCSPKNKISQHHVIDDVIYEKTADLKLC